MISISRRNFVCGTGALLLSTRVLSNDAAERRKALGEIVADINKTRTAKENEIAAARAKGELALFRLPPRVVPFLDWDFFYIDDVLTWASDKNQKLPVIRAPKGFVTDLASIPQPLWSVLPRTGRYAYPAIVHDYMYWTQTTTREVADNVLLEAMKELDVSVAERESIYRGVRVGGGRAWESNKRAKLAGEKRVLKQFPENSLVAWSTWKAKAGVFD